MNDTIALMARRRSVAPQHLDGPGPSPDELDTLLRLASRVPDHGKLVPWRFIVIEGAARDRVGRLALETRLANHPDLNEADRQVELARFSRAPLVVAVVSRAAAHAKIPLWEQVLSAGGVCMALTVAATALGFGSAWLTEWCAYDARFRMGLGLAAHETVAGFVHIGRPKMVPEDRVRPALADIVTYLAD